MSKHACVKKQDCCLFLAKFWNNTVWMMMRRLCSFDLWRIEAKRSVDELHRYGSVIHSSNERVSYSAPLDLKPVRSADRCATNSVWKKKIVDQFESSCRTNILRVQDTCHGRCWSRERSYKVRNQTRRRTMSTSIQPDIHV